MTRRAATASHISTQFCNLPDSAECVFAPSPPPPTSPRFLPPRRADPSPRERRRVSGGGCSPWRRPSVSPCQCLWARPYRVWQRECLSVCVLASVSLTVLRLFPVTGACVRARAQAPWMCLVVFPLVERSHVLRHSAALLMMQLLEPSPSLHVALLQTTVACSWARGCSCCVKSVGGRAGLPGQSSLRDLDLDLDVYRRCNLIQAPTGAFMLSVSNAS